MGMAIKRPLPGMERRLRGTQRVIRQNARRFASLWNSLMRKRDIIRLHFRQRIKPAMTIVRSFPFTLTVQLRLSMKMILHTGQMVSH